MQITNRSKDYELPTQADISIAPRSNSLNLLYCLHLFAALAWSPPTYYDWETYLTMDSETSDRPRSLSSIYIDL